jgi:hypothetical protein
LGTLLPWNLFITEKQYFDVRVQQPPTQPALADNFENIIVVSFQLMCVALVLLASVLAASHQLETSFEPMRSYVLQRSSPHIPWDGRAL